MRIVLIGPSYPFRGGISHYTTLLYRHLRRRHDVLFLSLVRQYPRWLYPGQSDQDTSEFPIREDGAERVLDPSNPLTWLRAIRRARQFRPDLIILPWWVAFWAPSYGTIVPLAKVGTAAKVIYLCHNVTPHEHQRYDKWLARWALRHGDGYIVHSRQDEQNLFRLFPTARVRRTVHPTYDVFNRYDITMAEARNRLGATGDTLLFFGFVRPYKGLGHLIDAMPHILAERDVDLWIVGEFWQNAEMYLSQIRSLGIEAKVHVQNEYVSNERVGVYFSAADAVVLPYISGTGSGIAQIAFGYERPIVATSVGDLPEIVEPGETGYIVPPGDPIALAQAALAIYDKPAAAWQANIRARRGRFSWDNLAQCIDELATEVGVCER
jgi:glycosyltransferase involved in cell wall biosynthesis